MSRYRVRETSSTKAIPLQKEFQKGLAHDQPMLPGSVFDFPPSCKKPATFNPGNRLFENVYIKRERRIKDVLLNIHLILFHNAREIAINNQAIPATMGMI